MSFGKVVDIIGLAVTNSKKMRLCLRRESKSSRDMDRLFAQVHCSHLHCFHQLDVCRGPALAVEQRRHVVVLHLELLHLPDWKGCHGDELKTNNDKPHLKEISEEIYCNYFGSNYSVVSLKL